MKPVMKLICGAALLGVCCRGMSEETVKDQEVAWSHEGLCKIVKPMQHDMKGRLPIFVWSTPREIGDNVVKLRQDGSLRKMIDDYTARGLGWDVVHGWQWTPAGAMAAALTLKEAGLPTFIRTGDASDPYLNAPKAKGKVATGCFSAKDVTEVEMDLPSLPKYDLTEWRGAMNKWMADYKAQGVTVGGFFSDHEKHPLPFNYSYEHQKANFAADYPPGALDSLDRYHRYVFGTLRKNFLDEALANPVLKVFPDALVGNYEDVPSSEAWPYLYVSNYQAPPKTMGRLNTIMPSVYANTSELPRHFNPDWPVTQALADDVYFSFMLEVMSSALANKGPGQKAIPYVSPYCPDNKDPRFMFRMSRHIYKEFLRHSILRGVDSFFLFSYSPDLAKGVPGHSAKDVFEMIEDTRAVCDELLEYREFLEKGTPLNFEVPAMRSRGVVWSGLRLGDRALIRTFTFSPQPKRLRLAPLPVVGVELEASDQGATYLVTANGKARKVDRAP